MLIIQTIVMMSSFVKILVTHGYTVSVQAYLNLILTCYITLRYLFAALTIAFKDTNLSYEIITT